MERRASKVSEILSTPVFEFDNSNTENIVVSDQDQNNHSTRSSPMLLPNNLTSKMTNLRENNSELKIDTQFSQDYPINYLGSDNENDFAYGEDSWHIPATITGVHINYNDSKLDADDEAYLNALHLEYGASPPNLHTLSVPPAMTLWASGGKDSDIDVNGGYGYNYDNNVQKDLYKMDNSSNNANHDAVLQQYYSGHTPSMHLPAQLQQHVPAPASSNSYSPNIQQPQQLQQYSHHHHHHHSSQLNNNNNNNNFDDNNKSKLNFGIKSSVKGMLKLFPASMRLDKKGKKLHYERVQRKKAANIEMNRRKKEKLDDTQKRQEDLYTRQQNRRAERIALLKQEKERWNRVRLKDRDLGFPHSSEDDATITPYMSDDVEITVTAGVIPSSLKPSNILKRVTSVLPLATRIDEVGRKKHKDFLFAQRNIRRAHRQRCREREIRYRRRLQEHAIKKENRVKLQRQMLAQRAALREERKATRAQQIAQFYHQLQAQINSEMGIDIDDTNVVTNNDSIAQADNNSQKLESKEVVGANDNDDSDNDNDNDNDDDNNNNHADVEDANRNQIQEGNKNTSIVPGISSSISTSVPSLDVKSYNDLLMAFKEAHLPTSDEEKDRIEAELVKISNPEESDTPSRSDDSVVQPATQFSRTIHSISSVLPASMRLDEEGIKLHRERQQARKAVYKERRRKLRAQRRDMIIKRTQKQIKRDRVAAIKKARQAAALERRLSISMNRISTQKEHFDDMDLMIKEAKAIEEVRELDRLGDRGELSTSDEEYLRRLDREAELHSTVFEQMANMTRILPKGLRMDKVSRLERSRKLKLKAKLKRESKRRKEARKARYQVRVQERRHIIRQRQQEREKKLLEWREIRDKQRAEQLEVAGSTIAGAMPVLDLDTTKGTLALAEALHNAVTEVTGKEEDVDMTRTGDVEADVEAKKENEKNDENIGQSEGTMLDSEPDVVKIKTNVDADTSKMAGVVDVPESDNLDNEVKDENQVKRLKGYIDEALANEEERQMHAFEMGLFIDDDIPEAEKSDDTIKEYKGLKKVVANSTRVLPAFLRIDREGRMIHRERVRTWRQKEKARLQKIALRERHNAVQTRWKEVRKREALRLKLEASKRKREEKLRYRQTQQALWKAATGKDLVTKEDEEEDTTGNVDINQTITPEAQEQYTQVLELNSDGEGDTDVDVDIPGNDTQHDEHNNDNNNKTNTTNVDKDQIQLKSTSLTHIGGVIASSDSDDISIESDEGLYKSLVGITSILPLSLRMDAEGKRLRQVKKRVKKRAVREHKRRNEFKKERRNLRQVQREREHALRVAARERHRLQRMELMKSKVNRQLDVTKEGLEMGLNDQLRGDDSNAFLVDEVVDEKGSIINQSTTIGATVTTGADGKTTWSRHRFSADPTASGFLDFGENSPDSASESEESMVEYTGMMRHLTNATKFLPVPLRLDKEGRIIRRQRAKTWKRQRRHQQRMLRYKAQEKAMNATYEAIKQRREMEAIEKRKAEKVRELRDTTTRAIPKSKAVRELTGDVDDIYSTNDVNENDNEMSMSQSRGLTDDGDAGFDSDFNSTFVSRANAHSGNADAGANPDLVDVVHSDDEKYMGVIGALRGATRVLPNFMRLDPAGRRIRQGIKKMEKEKIQMQEQRRRERDYRYLQRRADWMQRHAERLQLREKEEAARIRLRDKIRRQHLIGNTSLNMDDEADYQSRDMNDEQEVALLMNMNPADDTESEPSRSDDSIESHKGITAAASRLTSFLPVTLRFDKEGKVIKRERARTKRKRMQHKIRTQAYRRRVEALEALRREKRRQDIMQQKRKDMNERAQRIRDLANPPMVESEYNEAEREVLGEYGMIDDQRNESVGANMNRLKDDRDDIGYFSDTDSSVAGSEDTHKAARSRGIVKTMSRMTRVLPLSLRLDPEGRRLRKEYHKKNKRMMHERRLRIKARDLRYRQKLIAKEKRRESKAAIKMREKSERELRNQQRREARQERLEERQLRLDAGESVSDLASSSEESVRTLVSASDSSSDPERSDDTIEVFQGFRGTLSNFSRMLPSFFQFDKEGRRLRQERNKTQARMSRQRMKADKSRRKLKILTEVRRQRLIRERLRNLDNRRRDAERDRIDRMNAPVRSTRRRSYSGSGSGSGSDSRSGSGSIRSDLSGSVDSRGRRRRRYSGSQMTGSISRPDLLNRVGGADDDSLASTVDIPEMEDVQISIVDRIRSATRILPLALRFDPEGRRLRREKKRAVKLERMVQHRRQRAHDRNRRSRIRERELRRLRREEERASIRQMKMEASAARRKEREDRRMEKRRQRLEARQRALDNGEEVADDSDNDSIVTSASDVNSQESLLLPSDTESDLESPDDEIVHYRGLSARLASLTRPLPLFLRFDKEGRSIKVQRSKTRRKEQRLASRLKRHRARLRMREEKLIEFKKRRQLKRLEELQLKKSLQIHANFENKVNQSGLDNDMDDKEKKARSYQKQQKRATSKAKDDDAHAVTDSDYTNFHSSDKSSDDGFTSKARRRRSIRASISMTSPDIKFNVLDLHDVDDSRKGKTKKSSRSVDEGEANDDNSSVDTVLSFQRENGMWGAMMEATKKIPIKSWRMDVESRNARLRKLKRKKIIKKNRKARALDREHRFQIRLAEQTRRRQEKQRLFNEAKRELLEQGHQVDPFDSFSDSEETVEKSDSSLKQYKGLKANIAAFSRILPMRFRMDTDGQIIQRARAKARAKENRHYERRRRHDQIRQARRTYLKQAKMQASYTTKSEKMKQKTALESPTKAHMRRKQDQNDKYAFEITGNSTNMSTNSAGSQSKSSSRTPSSSPSRYSNLTSSIHTATTSPLQKKDLDSDSNAGHVSDNLSVDNGALPPLPPLEIAVHASDTISGVDTIDGDDNTSKAPSGTATDSSPFSKLFPSITPFTADNTDSNGDNNNDNETNPNLDSMDNNEELYDRSQEVEEAERKALYANDEVIALKARRKEERRLNRALHRQERAKRKLERLKDESNPDIKKQVGVDSESESSATLSDKSISSLDSSDNSSVDRGRQYYMSRIKGAFHKVAKTLLPLTLRSDRQGLRLKREKQRQYRLQERLYKERLRQRRLEKHNYEYKIRIQEREKSNDVFLTQATTLGKLHASAMQARHDYKNLGDVTTGQPLHTTIPPSDTIVNSDSTATAMAEAGLNEEEIETIGEKHRALSYNQMAQAASIDVKSKPSAPFGAGAGFSSIYGRKSHNIDSNMYLTREHDSDDETLDDQGRSLNVPHITHSPSSASHSPLHGHKSYIQSHHNDYNDHHDGYTGPSYVADEDINEFRNFNRGASRDVTSGSPIAHQEVDVYGHSSRKQLNKIHYPLGRRVLVGLKGLLKWLPLSIRPDQDGSRYRNAMNKVREEKWKQKSGLMAVRQRYLDKLHIRKAKAEAAMQRQRSRDLGWVNSKQGDVHTLGRIGTNVRINEGDVQDGGWLNSKQTWDDYALNQLHNTTYGRGSWFGSSRNAGKGAWDSIFGSPSGPLPGGVGRVDSRFDERYVNIASDDDTFNPDSYRRSKIRSKNKNIILEEKMHNGRSGYQKSIKDKRNNASSSSKKFSISGSSRKRLGLGEVDVKTVDVEEDIYDTSASETEKEDDEMDIEELKNDDASGDEDFAYADRHQRSKPHRLSRLSPSTSPLPKPKIPTRIRRSSNHDSSSSDDSPIKSNRIQRHQHSRSQDYQRTTRDDGRHSDEDSYETIDDDHPSALQKLSAMARSLPSLPLPSKGAVAHATNTLGLTKPKMYRKKPLSRLNFVEQGGSVRYLNGDDSKEKRGEDGTFDMKKLSGKQKVSKMDSNDANNAMDEEQFWSMEEKSDNEGKKHIVRGNDISDNVSNFLNKYRISSQHEVGNVDTISSTTAATPTASTSATDAAADIGGSPGDEPERTLPANLKVVGDRLYDSFVVSDQYAAHTDTKRTTGDLRLHRQMSDTARHMKTRRFIDELNESEQAMIDNQRRHQVPSMKVRTMTGYRPGSNNVNNMSSMSSMNTDSIVGAAASLQPQLQQQPNHRRSGLQMLNRVQNLRNNVDNVGESQFGYGELTQREVENMKQTRLQQLDKGVDAYGGINSNAPMFVRSPDAGRIPTQRLFYEMSPPIVHTTIGTGGGSNISNTTGRSKSASLSSNINNSYSNTEFDLNPYLRRATSLKNESRPSPTITPTPPTTISVASGKKGSRREGIWGAGTAKEVFDSSVSNESGSDRNGDRVIDNNNLNATSVPDSGPDVTMSTSRRNSYKNSDGSEVYINPILARSPSSPAPASSATRLSFDSTIVSAPISDLDTSVTTSGTTTRDSDSERRSEATQPTRSPFPLQKASAVAGLAASQKLPTDKTTSDISANNFKTSSSKTSSSGSDSGSIRELQPENYNDDEGNYNTVDADYGSRGRGRGREVEVVSSPDSNHGDVPVRRAKTNRSLSPLPRSGSTGRSSSMNRKASSSSRDHSYTSSDSVATHTAATNANPNLGPRKVSFADVERYASPKMIDEEGVYEENEVVADMGSTPQLERDGDDVDLRLRTTPKRRSSSKNSRSKNKTNAGNTPATSTNVFFSPRRSSSSNSVRHGRNMNKNRDSPAAVALASNTDFDTMRVNDNISTNSHNIYDIEGETSIVGAGIYNTYTTNNSSEMSMKELEDSQQQHVEELLHHQQLLQQEEQYQFSTSRSDSKGASTIGHSGLRDNNDNGRSGSSGSRLKSIITGDYDFHTGPKEDEEYQRRQQVLRSRQAHVARQAQHERSLVTGLYEDTPDNHDVVMLSRADNKDTSQIHSNDTPIGAGNAVSKNNLSMTVVSADRSHSQSHTLSPTSSLKRNESTSVSASINTPSSASPGKKRVSFGVNQIREFTNK